MGKTGKRVAWIVVLGLLMLLDGPLPAQSQTPPPEPPPEPPQGMTQGPPPGPPRLKCNARFDALDTNHDGVVTREEFLSARHRRGWKAQDRFNRLDVNGDGVLTREEFCAKKGRGRVQ
jgi:hypothetical protein